MSARAEFHQKRGVSLQPLKLSKQLKTKGFMTFDSETKDGLIGKQLFCWSIGYFDKQGNPKTHSGNAQDLNRFFEIAKSNDKDHERVVFVHNLAFDWRFLCQICARQGIKKTEIFSGSDVLAVDIPDLNIKLMDSVQFLKTSQEKAEIEWNIPSKYTKIDCKTIFEKPYKKWSVKDKQLVKDHNKNDVMALLLIMKDFRDTLYEVSNVDVLNKVSLSAVALEAFRKIIDEPIPNPFIFTKKNDTKRFTYDYEREEEKFVRSSYFGGRCEVFNTNRQYNCAYVDRVSMYPTEMFEKEFPFGFGNWENNKDYLMKCISRKIKAEGFIYCEIIPNESFSKYPIFPYRMDEKIMFTNCTIKGCYAIPELRYAFENGYQIIPLKGFIFTESKKVFSKYIDTFFQIKKKSKGGKRQTAKYLMNQLYGKMGEAFERKELIYHYVEQNDYVNFMNDSENENKNIVRTTWDNIDKVWIVSESIESIRVKPYMNVCLASYTTAYSRIALHKKLHECELLGIDVYYCDTDSITIENKNLSKLTNMGKELGNWDIENEFSEVQFLAPKSYCAIAKGIPFLRMKGIDRRKIEEIVTKCTTLDEIISEVRLPIQLAEKYMMLKEAHRHGLIVASKKLAKHYSFENAKRKFTNGLSEPFNNATLPEKFKKCIEIS